jgi:hypothetical protein
MPHKHGKKIEKAREREKRMKIEKAREREKRMKREAMRMASISLGTAIEWIVQQRDAGWALVCVKRAVKLLEVANEL